MMWFRRGALRRGIHLGWVILLGLPGLALGCSTFQSLDSRSPQRKQADAALKCSGGSRTWKLGSGSLEDIAEREPEFYRYGPNTSFKNKLQVARLKAGDLPDGLTLSPRTVDGQRLLEFKGPATAPERILLLSSSRGRQLLLVPTECPEIEIEETCVDRRLQVSIEAENTIPCFDGYTGDLTVLGNGISEETIRPGQPLRISGSGGAFITLKWRTQNVYSGPVPLDNFKNATPALLFAVLEHGDDSTALEAFRNLDPQWVSPNLNETLRTVRLSELEKRLASEDVAAVYQSTSLDTQFPGTEGVEGRLKVAVEDEFRGLVASSPSSRSFLRAFELYRLIAPDTGGLDVEGLEVKYGPTLAEGSLGDDPEEQHSAEEAYMMLRPTGTFVTDILTRRDTEKTARQAAAATASRDRATQSAWYDLEADGIEIIKLEYRANWLTKYGPDTKRNRRGLKAMRMMVSERKQQFCSAKREFVSLVGAKEFREKTNYLCNENTPVENLGAGDVELKSQCHALYNGC